MKSAIGDLTQRIREEFDEAPGLEITVEEGVRFWAHDADTCSKGLSALHNAGFLVRTRDGRYHRARGNSTTHGHDLSMESTRSTSLSKPRIVESETVLRIPSRTGADEKNR